MNASSDLSTVAEYTTGMVFRFRLILLLTPYNGSERHTADVRAAMQRTPVERAGRLTL
jgi:hypothetical protein